MEEEDRPVITNELARTALAALGLSRRLRGLPPPAAKGDVIWGSTPQLRPPTLVDHPLCRKSTGVIDTGGRICNALPEPTWHARPARKVVGLGKGFRSDLLRRK